MSAVTEAIKTKIYKRGGPLGFPFFPTTVTPVVLKSIFNQTVYFIKISIDISVVKVGLASVELTVAQSIVVF